MTVRIASLVALLALVAGGRADGPTLPAKARRNVAIFVHDGVELLDFAGPGEVFAAAGGGRAFRVYTVAASRDPVTSQGFLKLSPEAEPKATIHADRRVVDNGKVVTAAGVSAGIDASVHVVGRLFGQKAAKDTARYMEYKWEPEKPAAKPAGR